MRAVSKANPECCEVGRLREPIAEITEEEEAHTGQDEADVGRQGAPYLSTEVKVVSAIEERFSVELRSAAHGAEAGVVLKQTSNRIASAKDLADLVKTAFEPA